MPQNVRYTARRSLITGHSAGSTYYLDLYLRRKDRQRGVNRDQQTSIGGSVYTTYHNGWNVHRCQTRPLTLTEAKAMREFLDSAEDGQVFQFDTTWWSGHSPQAYVNVVLQNNGYSESRVDRGGDQTGDRFTFSFELRETT